MCEVGFQFTSLLTLIMEEEAIAMDTTEEVTLRKEEQSDSDSEKLESSDEELSDDDSKIEAEAAALDAKLLANPWDYDSHVALVAALRQLGELPRLRAAREHMSKRFPITPALWLTWLDDEVKLATTQEERESVRLLFERAVLDYTSVDVWLEYASFALGGLGSDEDGESKTRAIFERGLTAAGLDVPRAALLWDTYREFEVAVAMPIAAAAAEGEEREAAWDRVARLYRRQLAVPLRNMQDTHVEFMTWAAEVGVKVDTANVDRAFKRATEKLAKVEPFEEAIEADGSADSWRRYIDAEWKGDSEPSRITALYERALAANCAVDTTFWLEYIEFLARQLKVECVLAAACKRAVRNCPWSGAIWQECLRAMERTHETHDAIKVSMEEALTSLTVADDVRELWLAFIDYMRRRTVLADGADASAEEKQKRIEELLAAIERAIQHIDDSFGNAGDPSALLLQRLSRTHAFLGDAEAFRAAQLRTLSVPGLAQCASIWLEMAQLERQVAPDGKHLRKLFARGLRQTRDWPESVGTAWLNYERDAGTLDQFESCLHAFRARVKEVTAQREKEAAQAQTQDSEGTVVARRRGHPQKGRDQETGRPEENRRERRENAGKGREEQAGTHRANLKRKHDEDGKWVTAAPRTEIVKAESAPKRGKVAPPPGYRPPEAGAAPADAAVPAAVPGPVAHDSTKDERTVFVSNLDFSVTEQQLRETFATSGVLTDVRLVADFKGRSKGFGYVEFDSTAAAAAALKRDREPIGTRPMFVSRCDPDQHTRQPGFKYSTGLEKNKLFVRGLPVSMTKAELELMFGEYGKLRDVRLVTYRNGHSKGLAYVEFESATAAGAAVLGVDGRTFGEHVVNVAISQPPERRAAPTPTPSLGGGGDREIGSRGRVKMAASLVPRAVQISRGAPTPTQSGNGTATKSDTAKPLSNQDFRSLLLGSKK